MYLHCTSPTSRLSYITHPESHESNLISLHHVPFSILACIATHPSLPIEAHDPVIFTRRLPSQTDTKPPSLQHHQDGFLQDTLERPPQERDAILPRHADGSALQVLGVPSRIVDRYDGSQPPLKGKRWNSSRADWMLHIGLYSQLVLMTVPVGGDIGDEVRPNPLFLSVCVTNHYV